MRTHCIGSKSYGAGLGVQRSDAARRKTSRPEAERDYEFAGNGVARAIAEGFNRSEVFGVSGLASSLVEARIGQRSGRAGRRLLAVEGRTFRKWILGIE